MRKIFGVRDSGYKLIGRAEMRMAELAFWAKRGLAPHEIPGEASQNVLDPAASLYAGEMGL